MIMSACVFPISGLLTFLCFLNITWADTAIDSSNNIKENAASLAPAVPRRRPVVAANDVFTSSFLVRFRRSVDNDVAHSVANKYGFDNLGPVSISQSIF